MAEIRVMVVDELAIMRAGVRSVLEASEGIRVVSELPDCEMAAGHLAEVAPDVLLIDADQDCGIAAIERVLPSQPATRVLAWSRAADEQRLFAWLTAGVSGFLLKRVSPEELVRAVRAVARGDRLLDPAVTGPVLDQVRWSRQNLVDQRLAALTPQERRVLSLLAEGCSNREIAAGLDLSLATVKNHVASVLSKLGVRRRGEAAAHLAEHRRHGGRWPLQPGSRAPGT
ncbi:MAG: response regulator transcription factor [Candidatus Dormibacteraeota bacterium]|nr:response regulator transcription factor [Candidatus Dormibacteraeota bacterium]